MRRPTPPRAELLAALALFAVALALYGLGAAPASVAVFPALVVAAIVGCDYGHREMARYADWLERAHDDRRADA